MRIIPRRHLIAEKLFTREQRVAPHRGRVSANPCGAPWYAPVKGTPMITGMLILAIWLLLNALVVFLRVPVRKR